MDKTQDSKKCYCTRCFLPIDIEDRVDIDGDNFHRICSMCCVCRTIPTSLKMFYGHVFCSDCFKSHVMTRFRGDSNFHPNSWWMQWAPGGRPQENQEKDSGPSASVPPEESKRTICARCLQPVDEQSKVEVCNQSFHTQCAKCYFCRKIPTANLKIYYGQVFCDECFHTHVLPRNRDNPAEFFKNWFEQWQNNAEFADQMRGFMAGSKDNTPFVFIQGQPPFCRCGTGPGWFQGEPKKSATPAVSIDEGSIGTWDENRTEISYRIDIPECHEDAAAEKIEKLTRYLHERSDYKCTKKWKNFVELDHSTSEFSVFGWIELQASKQRQLDCPKCLWQCGPIYVNSEYLRKQVA